MGQEAQDLDALMRRLQAGDRAAMAPLVDGVQDALRRFLFVFTADATLVGELVQDTLVTAWEKAAAYRAAPSGPLPWLRGIARNLLLRELRARAGGPGDGQDRLAILEAADALAEAERLQEVDGDLRRLRRCLDRLAPAARTLVDQVYFQGRRLCDLEAEGERSASWLRVTLHRSRLALRSCIEAGP